MKQSRTRLAQTIADRSLKKGSSSALAREVAAYLLAEGRVDELDSVLRDVQNDWAGAGYVEVLASSAHPLNSAAQKDIKARVSKIYPGAKTVHVTQIIDPEVIGGVRLSLPNQQLDLSVEAKLDRFKQLTAGKD